MSDDPDPVVVPGPSAEERDLQKQQAALLGLQRTSIEKALRREELLDPILLKAAGLKPVTDAQGNVTGYEELPDPNAEKRKELESLYLERATAAAKGELPVNPGLLRDLTKSEETLRERMRKNLGPGWETSTPGIEALQGFEESKNITLDAARRGDLTTFEQLSLGRENAIASDNASTLANVYGIPRNMAALGGMAGAGADSYNAALAGYRADRDMIFRGSAINAQLQSQRQSTFGQIAGGIGKLAGVAAGTALGGGSKPWWL